MPLPWGTNSEASASDDDEAGCQVSDFDVWFKFVATFACTGSVTVDTFGSGQEDTVLSVFDACGGVEIVCNDDAGGDTLSQVTFDATSGQSYWIRLASFAAPGDFDLNISCSRPPANDDCASALLVTEGTPAAGGSNSAASSTDDAEATCQLSDFDVWFEYVATRTGSVTVDTFGSAQEDTVLSVYEDCGGTEIACNDDAGGGTHAEVTITVAADQSYWIRLTSFGAPGDYDLNITCVDDTDGDGVCDSVDNCELFNPDQLDCQSNGVGDVCDLDDGTSQDCNENTIPDECDLSDGTSDDCDANGTPDECEPCPGDLDCDGVVDAFDLATLLGSWGPCDGCPADIFDDGDVNARDLAQLLGAWGICP